MSSTGSDEVGPTDDGEVSSDADESSSESGAASPRACELLEATYAATTYVGAHRDVVSNGTALFLAEADGVLSRSIIHENGSDNAVLVDDLGAELLAADASWVYWAGPHDTPTELGRVAVDGSASEALLSEPAGVAALVTMDGDLYWVNAPDSFEDAELKVLRAGADAPETLLLLDGLTLQLATSAGLVYGVRGAFHSPGDGLVFAVDAAGVEHALATGGASGVVHVTDTWTYWASATELWRTPRAGGEPSLLYDASDFACTVGWIRAITGLANDVFVATEQAIVRVRGDTGEAEVIESAQEYFYPDWIGTIGDDLVWHEVQSDGEASTIRRLLLP
jgi:hypothetical protein